MKQTFSQNNEFHVIGNRVNRFATGSPDRYSVRMSIGGRIKKFRKEKGLSQTALGNAVGAAQTTIAGYECNSSEPNMEMVRRIANELGVSPGVIAFGGIDAGTTGRLSYARIIGKIEQDAWRGQAKVEAEIGKAAFVPHPNFPSEQQLAFQVSDRSCDMVIPVGGFVIAIPFELFPGGLPALLVRDRPPLVIIERSRDSSFEYTIKEIRNDAGIQMLQSKTTDLSLKRTTPLNNIMESEGVRIAFVVISVVQNLI